MKSFPLSYRIALFFCLALLVFMTANAGYAQAPLPAVRLDGAVDPKVVKTGEPVVVSLTLVNGEVECQKIETRRPLDIILVLDRSQSMDEPLGGQYQGSKLQGALEAIGNFLGLIDAANDRVALIIYSSEAVTLTPLGTPEQMKSILNASPSGFNSAGTNIEAGLTNALELAVNGRRSNASPVVILLSDGNETEGSARSLAEEIKKSRIRLLSIGLGPDVDEGLMRTITTSPSDYYYAPNTENLDDIYETIAKTIQQYDPATDIKVSYTFNASNFTLVEDSVQPAADVDLNTITWTFPRIENNQEHMQVTLLSKVSGEQNVALSTELQYTRCGEMSVLETPPSEYTVEVVDKGPVSNVACGDNPPATKNFLTLVCQDYPYGLLAGLLAGIILLILWLWQNWNEIKAWQRCYQPVRPCTWSKLALYIWTAVVIGVLSNLLVSYMCSVQSGLMFWRILPDRSSAIYVQPIEPNLNVRAITPITEERNCIGCHDASNTAQSIVAVASATNGKLLTADLHGVSHPIPDLQGSYPAISPDGRLIAFAANNQDIYIYNMETSTSQPLDGASDPVAVESMPAWSADGNKIAFVRASGAGQEATITVPSDIMVIPTEGGVPVLLAGASTLGYNYHPAFSPDGKWLAFSHHDDGTTTYGDPKAEIFLVPSDGGTARRIQANDGPGGQVLVDAGNTWPTWSRDGKTLYFSSRRCDNQYDLFSTQIDGMGNSTPATRLPAISDPDAFEYRAQEIEFQENTPASFLFALLPWLLPLLLLALATAWLCLPSRKVSKTPTVKISSIDAEPPRGWLLPDQRFKVQIELIGDKVNEQRAMNRPVDAVILLDTSSSMNERMGRSASRMDVAKKAAAKFVQCGMGTRERMGLVSFSDDAQVRNGLTEHDSDVILAINKLTPDGSTSMAMGLGKAYQLLLDQARKNASKVIILLSDGEPTDSRDEVLAVARKIHDLGIHLIAVGIGEADSELLNQIAPNDYRLVNDARGLINIFLQKAREIKKPVAATEVQVTHLYDNDHFELVPGSVNPAALVHPGVLTWELDELDTQPVLFEYSVRPLVAGEYDIAVPGSTVRYTRCGIGPKISTIVQPGASVLVENIDVPEDIPLRELKPPVKLVASTPVWQPDRALFIGIGGAGKWILTHLLSNLLNAGNGQIPVDRDGNQLIRFLAIDTNEHESHNAISFAGLRIPSQDTFILDENLGPAMTGLAAEKVISPEYQEWLKPVNYRSLAEQLNLSNGTFKRRPLARLALIRNLTADKGINSTWLELQRARNKSASLRDWIQERCTEVLRKDQLTRIRIFIVGSLAGGLSGIVNDVTALAQDVGSKIAGDKGGVRIEGYFVDGAPYANLFGSTGNIPQANSFATLRELSRFQLNPGKPYELGWCAKKIDAPLFDDLLIFSQDHNPSVIGQAGNTNTEQVARRILSDYVYPSIADVLSVRIDQATGAAGPDDWFNHMQMVRTNRQKKENQLIAGSAGIYSIRVPVQDILRSLQVRWAFELLRMFLTNDIEAKVGRPDVEDEHVTFNLSLQSIGSDTYNQDPQQMVKRYLLGGQFGGDGSPATRALFDYLLDGKSALADSKELQDDLDRDEQYLFQEQFRRLGRAIEVTLVGKLLGARRNRIAYALQFLKSVEDRLLPLSARLKSEWKQPELARFAEVCVRAAQAQMEDMDRLCRLISQNEAGQPDGIWERISRLASKMSDIENELNQISSRMYIWGIPNQAPGTDRRINRFAEQWWKEYFAGRAVDYLDCLSWSSGVDGKVDLLVRIQDRPRSLTQDGPEAVLQALVEIGASLSHDRILASIDLPQLINSYQLLTPEMGSKIGSLSTPICSTNTDPDVSPDSLILVAPSSTAGMIGSADLFLSAFKNAAVQQLSVSTTRNKSTEPMWIAFLHLRNGVRVNTWQSYHRAQSAYDQEDGIISSGSASRVSPTHRAVYKCEAEARALELSTYYKYRQAGTLHPYLVSALQHPHRTELFCLALAEGLIVAQPGRPTMLQIPNQAPQVLVSTDEIQIDPYVDALLDWAYQLPAEHQWNQRTSMLEKRYLENAFVAENLLKWYEAPPSDFVAVNHLRASLGYLTNAIVRQYGENKHFRWTA